MVKYKQIAGELRNQILSAGNLKPHKLPTEWELCQKYGVSRQTVRQALLTLEDEKLITRRQGSGAYTVPQAEHLREKKIILLISEENEYIYPKFIATLRSELRRHNLSLTVFATENDINKERTILTKLLDESAFLIISELPMSIFPNPNMDLYEKLMVSGTKIIFLNQNPTHLSGAFYLYSDDMTGGFLAGEYLISMHRTRPFVLLPDYVYNAHLRYAGLQAAYRDYQISIPSDNVFRYSKRDLHLLRTRRDTGFLTEFVQNHATNCDSVLCYSDEIAYRLIKELSYAGISVPEQLSVISFDNSYLSTLSNPALTSLGMSAEKPATSLCSMIQSLLHEKETENIILPWKIFSRGSTK